MKFQEHFVKTVKHYFGREGEEWLLRLPRLINHCEERWQLRMLAPYSLSINYVAPAVKLTGEKLVVKCCIPGKEFLNELEALRLLKGERMGAVIDWDDQNGIILLEKLEPGLCLAELEDDEEACRISASVFKNITRRLSPGEARGLPSTHDREKSLREIIRNHPEGTGPITGQMLKQALKLYTYLNGSTRERWILHGDFHPYNILLTGQDDWKAIDPKGLTGEREADLIQFILNKLPEDKEKAYGVIRTRSGIFAEELNLDKQRLLLWGYAHAVLSTSWTVDGRNYDKKFFNGIDIFRKLYEEITGNYLENLSLD
ncbi:aminoglycoside phosphotransferase family protein [Evansella sp. LMS18]|jgi:streptomycin 6-kinase|uniref:aminoglycoside phosphotransferase family protein n=1 Tax=Evansella sp. LMS18 TaxID=2924033 RepID=UPI0020D12F8A|nr:aminoglycoside phosphotransferase family protein [Evansella sp. LMS18]UTR09848.1 aminoglycoside phosphotransferase family protein [Evansella sp. LMS18]